jgi:Ethylbenzene dehydrogenase
MEVAMKHLLRLFLTASATVLMGGNALSADVSTIDWDKIPTATISLFYPGQSSLEWLQTPSHPGAQQVASGMPCLACHQGQEQALGKKLVAGGPLEPAPVKGKVGNVDLMLQVAYDDKNAYFRARWKTQNPYPGNEHQYLRFDGTAWKVYGYPKLDKVVQDGTQPGIYEDRFSFMIDDGKVERFAQQGCWLTCHNGERDMPNQFKSEEVQANALYKAIKQNDVRKYLPATRTNPADWKSGKPIEEIAKLKEAGQFTELVQWRAHRSAPVGMADDGYVLEFRNLDAGKNMFSGNFDRAKAQPRLMWDEKKVGYKSIPQDQLRKGDHFLIREDNAVPFDPNAGWKAGDMIPDYALSRGEAAGSAADNKAISSWKDGMWTVVVVRPLGLTNPDDKALQHGGVFNIGLAVHDDNITTRGHHVSFIKSLGFGLKADIEAVRLP